MFYVVICYYCVTHAVCHIFTVDSKTNLAPLPKWRLIFMKAAFLKSNWIKGHYNVLPTLRAHKSRVSAIASNGKARLLTVGELESVVLFNSFFSDVSVTELYD